MLHQNKEAFLIQMVNLYWQPQIPDRSTGLAKGSQDHPSYQLPATMGKLPFAWNQKAHFPAGTSASDTSQKSIKVRFLWTSNSKSPIEKLHPVKLTMIWNIMNPHIINQYLGEKIYMCVCVWNSENRSPGVSITARIQILPPLL